MAERDHERKDAGRDREATLAQALRANLRRRKAAAPAKPVKAPPDERSD